MIKFKLIQLSNGTWIDPSGVVAVLASGGGSRGGDEPPRVEVISDRVLTIPCDYFKVACDLRDEIAERVNRSRF